MDGIYKNKEIKSENNSIYEILYSLENSLNIERKIDVFFSKFQLISKFMRIKTINEIQLLSLFIREKIYAIQLYVLKDDFESNSIKEINDILTIVNLILKLQDYYTDFIYNTCIYKKSEEFDINSVEEYQKNINDKVKKLELKNI